MVLNYDKVVGGLFFYYINYMNRKASFLNRNTSSNF